MSKLTTVLLALLISLSLKNMEAAESVSRDAVKREPAAAANKGKEPISGLALKQEDEAQIALLQGKFKEAQDSGAQESTLLIIQSYIDLAKEMKELNDKRHALHEAVKGFEKGVGVFSEEIKAIVQKVNSILAAQAEQALKNAELRKLLADPSPTATTIAVSANKPAEGG
ncbi:MAG: hypothetical protein ACK4V2_02765 [Pseudomonadota bacterium]|jgi:hypothetical protein|nr:hypothetical protein [Alphaproteobacteria bacterium]